jgi:glycosyltransferase involved in cell wall biosynthesis
VQKPSISLIVSTFNQPDFLRLILCALVNQVDTDFELIIADDGSNEETKKLIEKFERKQHIAVTHIWHEDNGFQKSQILNKAALASKNEYLVFLDGDCIPRTKHIQDHRSLARKNRIVGCSRVLLDETLMSHTLNNQLEAHCWSLWKVLGFRISGHLDFLAIGGFDESFTGWGYEDSELAARAIHSGCLVRLGDYRGTVFHLWHTEVSREEAKSNKSSLEETLESGRKTARSSSIIG